MFTAFMLALTLTSVANVLVTMALGPLFTALVARVFHRPPHCAAHLGRHRGGRRAALPRCMAARWRQAAAWLGTLVALCVPIAGAANWTVMQHSHAQGHDVDLVPAVLIGAVLSSLVTLPLALPFQATAHDIGLLALLGVVQLAIPCVLAVLCARVLKAPECRCWRLLEVIFGILLAWLGADEVPAMLRCCWAARW